MACTVGNVCLPEVLPPRGELVFDANFESGNLGRFESIGGNEYDLFIRPDTCNSKYRVWFYFAVQNALDKQRVVFNVVNFSKLRSLFDTGAAAPVVRSESQAQWQRVPTKHLYYYRSTLHGDRLVLSFAFVFDTPEKVYFAYCIPYTYSYLRDFLSSLEARQLSFFERTTITETVQKRPIDLISIEDCTTLEKKKVILITGRVHPGETPSSHVVHGIIDFLVSEDPRAVKMRAQYSFKIIPMLNPDGVVLGNYRCSLLGFDLNRHWRRPSQWAQPSIYAAKNLFMQYHQSPQHNVLLYLDVHAHSQKTNSFLYGNVPSWQTSDTHLWLPRSIAALADDFSLPFTQFNRDVDKEGTARRSMGAILACHCYTLEVSFFSYRLNGKAVHYTKRKYEMLGEHVAVGILHYMETLSDERSTENKIYKGTL